MIAVEEPTNSLDTNNPTRYPVLLVYLLSHYYNILYSFYTLAVQKEKRKEKKKTHKSKYVTNLMNTYKYIGTLLATNGGLSK